MLLRPVFGDGLNDLLQVSADWAGPHFIDGGDDGQVMLTGHAFLGDDLDDFLQKNEPQGNQYLNNRKLFQTRSCHEVGRGWISYYCYIRCLFLPMHKLTKKTMEPSDCRKPAHTVTTPAAEIALSGQHSCSVFRRQQLFNQSRLGYKSFKLTLAPQNKISWRWAHH